MCFVLSYVLHASCHLILNVNLWGRNYHFAYFTYKKLGREDKLKEKTDLRVIIWLLKPSFSLPEKLQMPSRERLICNRPDGTDRKSTCPVETGQPILSSSQALPCGNADTMSLIPFSSWGHWGSGRSSQHHRPSQQTTDLLLMWFFICSQNKAVESWKRMQNIMGEPTENCPIKH